MNLNDGRAPPFSSLPTSRSGCGHLQQSGQWMVEDCVVLLKHVLSALEQEQAQQVPPDSRYPVEAAMQVL